MTTEQYLGQSHSVTDQGGAADKFNAIHKNPATGNAQTLGNLPAAGNKAPGKEGTSDLQQPETGNTAKTSGYF